jgi:tetratricopeptide (TPR) repeat protein
LNEFYAQSYCNLGVVLNDLLRFDEAEAFYKKSISLEPEHAPSYNNLGVTLGHARKFDEAEESYRKAISIDNNYKDAIAGLGDILIQKGKYKEGLVNLRIGNGSIFFDIKNGLSVISKI